jgi:hypothetical protein
MTFKANEPNLIEKLKEYEIADLEAYCDENGIKGKDKDVFIRNSMKELYEVKNGKNSRS